MPNAQEKHNGTVSIGGRTITNLQFADDIYTFAEKQQELEALVQSLDKRFTRYEMEISAEKPKPSQGIKWKKSAKKTKGDQG